MGGKCQKWANSHTCFAGKLVVLTELICKNSALALTFQWNAVHVVECLPSVYTEFGFILKPL